MKYTHPNVILDDYVTIAGIEGDEVYFVKSDRLVHKSWNGGNFIFNAQYKHCQLLITMPIKCFVKLMTSPAAPILNLDSFTLVSSTGRCGSTLAGIVFEKYTSTEVISEPLCLMPFTVNPDSWKSDVNMESKGLVRLQILKV